MTVIFSSDGMAEHKMVEFHQLEAGYEFSPSSYQLQPSMVNAYLEAVEETGAMYHDTGLAPPLVAAALAMTALSDNLSFPAGAIHISQEFEFMDTVNANDILTSYTSVTRKQDRGKLHILTITFNVFNQQPKEVLSGKTTFLLPEQT